MKESLTNLQIAELLRDVAAAYKLQDENKFRFQIIAYERAADSIEHATSELKDLWDDGKLSDVPGIGASITSHLDELFKTGHSKHFDDLLAPLPKIMFEFMKVPGIGAKTGYKLATELKLKSMADLEKAATDGKIAQLEGFGEESQNKILKGIKDNYGKKGAIRHLLPYAMVVASEVIEYLNKNKNVLAVNPLGSLRRKAATVGDIDISVATSNPAEVLGYFVKYPKTQKIIEKGEHSASIVAPGGVQVDLMVQPPDAYGSLLQHFTGSKLHNVALREYAIKKGFSLNEYGISKSEVQKKVDKKRSDRGEVGKVKFKTEKEFYNYLGLDYIEPELREDTGEIEAAKNHNLPKLIELKDIKADLQMHSSFDIETSHDLGESSMEALVKKGNELDYEYLAFTEHNPSQKGHTDNNIVEILKKKREKVDQLNYSIGKSNTKGIQKMFNSLEIDMKPDGTLPVPEAGLATLDFALVSIHSSFDLERSAQTKRVLAALNHPKVKIFAHPTGRKINEREGAELNWPEIFDFCLKNNKWIEINCDPMRLDLPDMLVREAVKLGVKLTFGTDAHHVDGMNNMIWGVSVARRGWAQKKDIINTLSLKEFEEMVQ
ncbi:MAG TPA: helix-hairpin-helix domain-containing protein [Patescibacteria group bacterium]|nr:helix-hairpin-helix domain-containing protein [Patescibacteria group bacterium]